MKRKLLILSVICLGLVAAGWVAWPHVLTALRNYGAARNREANRLPADALHALVFAPDLTLFSINPDRSTELTSEVPKFHKYEVLGHITTLSPEQRRQLASTLEHALERWSGHWATNCWSPRHAIRATDGAHAYEFVICFECGKLAYFPSSGGVRYLEIRSKPGPFNDILIAAKVPLPKQPRNK